VPPLERRQPAGLSTGESTSLENSDLWDRVKLPLALRLLASYQTMALT
jgi:hypothetical protein